MPYKDPEAQRAYYRERARRYRMTKPGWKPKIRPYATCHPEKPHRAKGLCNACYLRTLHQRIYTKRREKHLAASRYRLTGWTALAYNEVMREQGGICAVCKGLPCSRGLMADHEHNTGKRRGLLCNRCNRALGLLRDDPQVVYAAWGYLTHYGDYSRVA